MSIPKMFKKTATVRESHAQVVVGVLTAVFTIMGCSPVESETADAPEQPEQPVKLVFVHHSCGENWLADSHGGLAVALAKNNYFLSDTNYGWGPDGIGDRTDITNWPEWFTGPRSREYLRALYRESDQNCEYTRTSADPGGENQIVMFKSCFPNSNLQGKATDKATRGQGLTVANAKAIYNELLKYFATQPDKLFVVVTAPPVQERQHASNARAFNRWLVQDWRSGYRGSNVVVFDFYNVLTDPGNHHRIRDGKVEYTSRSGGDTLYYPTDSDNHPSPAGNRKATEEFVPLLNAYYNKWAATRPKKARASKPSVGNMEDVTTEKTPMAVENPPQEESAAITGADMLIDDFERQQRAWTKFIDAEKDTRLKFSKDKTTKHNGAASFCIQYDLAPESLATCALTHDRPRDWSRSGGLSFYLHTEKLGQSITIVAYGGKSSDDLLHFECELKASQAAVDGWQRIDIPWSRLRLPQWQGDSTAKYDSRSAMGVAFTFHSSAEGRQTGKIWIDDVTLLPKKAKR
jgi:hypothetical protein